MPDNDEFQRLRVWFILQPFSFIPSGIQKRAQFREDGNNAVDCSRRSSDCSRIATTTPANANPENRAFTAPKESPAVPALFVNHH